MMPKNSITKCVKSVAVHVIKSYCSIYFRQSFLQWLNNSSKKKWCVADNTGYSLKLFAHTKSKLYKKGPYHYVLFVVKPYSNTLKRFMNRMNVLRTFLRKICINRIFFFCIYNRPQRRKHHTFFGKALYIVG